jgi:hypothetical protein
MQATKTYHHAHLFVAAIRILDHQKSTPPTIEDVCQLINFSLERGHFICNNLVEREIIKIVEGSYGMRLFIRDHTLLEDIPQDEQENKLDQALKQFQAAKKGYADKVASIQADQKEKRKNLFADLEKKLKTDLKNKNK